MKKNVLWMIGIAVLLVAAGVVVWLVRPGAAQGDGASQSDGAAAQQDPQTLLIPRWFLSSIVLDGKEVNLSSEPTDTLPNGRMSIQFKEGGEVNGQGACNGFGGTYEADTTGKLTFSPLMSTLMACADQARMDEETAYFQALGKVERFERTDRGLKLSSADGKTVVTFGMPPK